MKRNALARRLLCGLLTLCFLAGNSTSSYAKKKETKENPSSSTAEEVAIGEQIHATIMESFYAYTDPKVTDYVKGIGTRLASHSERTELPYQFTVLYNDKIYASSAPGGFIYITTGMLYFLENESQLAAVLAHEIAQLQYRDPKNSRARKTLDTVTKGGAVVASAFGPFGALAAIGLVGVNGMVQPHSLTIEQRAIRADQKAIRYMLEAGIDPQGMVDLIYRFSGAKTDILPYFYDYYQSRPITQVRSEAIMKEFSKLSMEGKEFNSNREIYMEATKGVREIHKEAML